MDIKTKDGIIIKGIPDGQEMSQPIRDYVANLRASGQGAGEYNYSQSPQNQQSMQRQGTPVQPKALPQEVPTETPAQNNNFVSSKGFTDFMKGTTAEGVGGALVRELSPVVTATAVNPALGAAVTGSKLIGDPIVDIVNHLFGDELQAKFGQQLTRPSDALTILFDKLGVAKPESEAEKVIQSMAQATAETAGTMGLGTALKTGGGLGQTVAKGIGETLTSQPVQQVAGAIGSAGASKVAEQQGAGVGGQLAAGLAGGLTGSALTNIKPGSLPKAPIKEAAKANIDLMTSDALPPKNFVGKWFQQAGEKIPVAGTGKLRELQQGQRVEAVKDLLREFGADDAANVSDDIMDDLIKTRSTKIDKFATNKQDVINKLSETVEPKKSTMFTPQETTSLEYRGKQLETGKPVEFDTIHNPAKNVVTDKTQFQMDIEPSGKYVSFSEGFTPEGWEESVTRLENPLVIDFNSVDGVDGGYNSNSWKSYLSKKTGKTGTELTDQLTKEGYDGIITIDSKYKEPSEVVLLNELKGGTKKPTITKNTVPVDNTLKAIDAEISKLKGLKSAELAPVIAKLEGWKTSLVDQDLQNIELLRKQMGQSFKSSELAGVKSIGEKSLNSIYAPLKADMGDYIKSAGSEADYNKWQVANKELSNMMGELDNSTLKRVLNKGEMTPEEVNKMLFSRNKSDVTQLYNQLSDSGKETAKTAILAKAVEKADFTGDYISPDKFVNNVKRLGNQTGVFFKGDDLKQVEGLMRVLNATKRAGQAAASPPTGVQNLIPVMAGGAGTAFGGGIEGFLGGLSALGAAGLTARAYESKPVRNLLMKIPTVKAGSTQEVALFKRLNEVVRNMRTTEDKQERSIPKEQ